MKTRIGTKMVAIIVAFAIVLSCVGTIDSLAAGVFEIYIVVAE